MHILMTVNAAWNIWNFRRPVVAALVGDGHRITVLAPPDESVCDLEKLGCRFLRLKMDVKSLNPLEGLKLLRRFKVIFQTERPDLILSYTIKNNIFGAMAAQSAGIPFIPNVSGLGTAFLSSKVLQTLAEALYRRAFGRLSVIFFQNVDDRDLFVQRRLVTRGQARLLPGSGVNLNHFAAVEMPAPDTAPIFLMISRLLRVKGVIEFVEAARKIKTQAPEVRFQLLGTVGSEIRTAIDLAAVRSSVEEGLVEYLGATSDVRSFIAAAHCVVLPSYREGAPRTLIEAASMGRPLIATDVPGCRSVLDRDVSGFLCEMRSADSLAAAMIRFLSLSHDAKVSMAQAGRAKMEREFDEAIVVNAYNDAIVSVNRGA